MIRVERGKLLRRVPYLAYGVLFVLGTIAALVGDKGYLDLRRLRAERERAMEEVSADRERVALARSAVAGLRGEGITRERIAREKLGLVEPGEVLILLSDDPRARTAPRIPIGGPTSGPEAEAPPSKPAPPPTPPPKPRPRARRR
jgi:cell division protein FtsB